MNADFWHGRSVFLTGHTGFKGGWMALWLTKLGAKVHGYSLDAPTTPSFYHETRIQERISSSTISDIRDFDRLASAMRLAQSSIVIHMAAQPIVGESYSKPVDTFLTNVIGTANVLEAARHVETVQAVVNITTDKCYHNQEWVWPYRENDRLGGNDPYSSSKACAEILTSAYRKSFLAKAGIQVATVRAGNVIGGGDWASGRLIPDFLRALDANKTLLIRSPDAIRPWQHVLEPLSGYLMLCERLVSDGEDFAEAWNFGPDDSGMKTVSWIVDCLCKKIPEANWELEGTPSFDEAVILKLDSSKAKSKLKWRPRWDLETTLEKIVDWHSKRNQGMDMAEVSASHIDDYSKDLPLC